MMKAKLALVPATALALALGSGQAFAGAKIFSSGGSVARVNGSVESNANQNRDPWVAQIFSIGNECLRIAVASQGSDLEATLISPSGTVWQDDDGNGSLRPLVKAITDVRGWYPLTLSHFAGAAVNADFAMDVQRLPSNSPRCQPATAPRSARAATSVKGASTGPGPLGGAN